MKHAASTAVSLTIALLFSTHLAGAQSARDEKYVLIGTTSKTVGYMAPWVAKVKGFFQAEGVRVDIPILRSATTGVQAARSNAWPPKGDIDVEGVKTQIQILAQRDNTSGPLPPAEKYINLNYLRAAQKELGM